MHVDVFTLIFTRPLLFILHFQLQKNNIGATNPGWDNAFLSDFLQILASVNLEIWRFFENVCKMIVFPLLKWFDVALKRGATIISTLTMEGFFMFFQKNKCISSIKQIKLSLKSSQKRRDDHFYSYYGRFFHVFSKINACHQKNKLSHPEILSKGSIFIKIYVKWSFSFRGGRGGQVRAWMLF